jgi:hypothetical protein
MKNITIYTVIPLFSNGVEINQNEVKSFADRDEASQYSSSLHAHFEFVESELSLDFNPDIIINNLVDGKLDAVGALHQIFDEECAKAVLKDIK